MKKNIATFILWILGWKIVEEIPQLSKYIIISAPHTSNWDFVIGRAFGYVLGIKAKYLAKHELFRFPYGWFFRLTGGIPVERDRNNNLVNSTTLLFQNNNELVVAIAPEGSRRRVKKWKQGFYHIAIAANVPIVLSFMDYKSKKAGVGKILYPSGNIEKDMFIIQEFYKNINPKVPDYYNPKIY